MNELQQRFGPRGLVVLGFPCNQFGHQVRRAERDRGGSVSWVAVRSLAPQPRILGVERPPQALFPPVLVQAGFSPPPHTPGVVQEGQRAW